MANPSLFTHEALPFSFCKLTELVSFATDQKCWLHNGLEGWTGDERILSLHGERILCLTT